MDINILNIAINNIALKSNLNENGGQYSCFGNNHVRKILSS